MQLRVESIALLVTQVTMTADKSRQFAFRLFYGLFECNSVIIRTTFEEITLHYNLKRLNFLNLVVSYGIFIRIFFNVSEVFDLRTVPGNGSTS